MRVFGPLIQPRQGDSGYDIPCPEGISLAPGEQAKIGTGIYVEIPPWCVGIIFDRSSVAARKLHVHGGVIDPSYRGEISVLLENTNQEYVTITAGSKIAQMVILPCYVTDLIHVNSVDELSETERGERGFGSTNEGTG